LISALVAGASCLAAAPAQFAGITPYGSPTLGCAGASSINASGPPIVGDSTFRLGCQGALPLAGGVLALSPAAQNPPIVYRSAYLWVNFASALTMPVTMTTAGIAAVPLPIPRQPALIGGDLFAQFVWADTGPTCAGNVLAATDAVQVTIQSPPDPGEPNDSAAQATPISSGTTLNRILCPAGDEDWFAFTTTGNAAVQIRVTPPAGKNYDLQLRNGSTALATSANSGSTPESISACVGAGTYYARVYAPAAAFDPFATYALAVTVAPITGTQTYNSSTPTGLINNSYHPTFTLYGFGTTGSCPERVTISISGTYSNLVCGGTSQLLLNANPQGQFTTTIGSTTLLGVSGSFTLRGSFTANPGVPYDIGMMASFAGFGCSVMIDSGTMTVTRS